MKDTLVYVFNIHVLKIILAAFCYNSFANAFVNQIFLSHGLPFARPKDEIVQKKLCRQVPIEKNKMTKKEPYIPIPPSQKN